VIHISHMYPPSTTTRFNTALQVNNMGVLHLLNNRRIYSSHNYYYPASSFTLLQHSLAGRLAPTTGVGNSYISAHPYVPWIGQTKFCPLKIAFNFNFFRGAFCH
jgi:hypothetical protein